MKITATRNGVTARFNELVWNSGVPARNGWIPTETIEGKKVLPKALVDLSNARKETLNPVGNLPKPGPTGEKKSAAESTNKPATKPAPKPAAKPVGKPAVKKPAK